MDDTEDVPDTHLEPGYFLLTLRTIAEESLFGCVSHKEMTLNAAGEILKRLWRHVPERYREVRLDTYVILPNHLHAIVYVDPGHIGDLIPFMNEEGEVANHEGVIFDLVDWFMLATESEITGHGGSLSRIWNRDFWERPVDNKITLEKLRSHLSANPSSWYYDKENPERAAQDPFKRLFDEALDTDYDEITY